MMPETATETITEDAPAPQTIAVDPAATVTTTFILQVAVIETEREKTGTRADGTVTVIGTGTVNESASDGIAEMTKKTDIPAEVGASAIMMEEGIEMPTDTAAAASDAPAQPLLQRKENLRPTSPMWSLFLRERGE